jgi:predicted RNase H-like HicB family nuclease
MKSNLIYRSEVFREGDIYVALCPDLDVSSFGETIDEAQSALHEAVEAFVEECERMGTLQEVLEESGYIRSLNNWLPRQPVTADLVALG